MRDYKTTLVGTKIYPVDEQGHAYRYSDSSHFDLACVRCGATDAIHGGRMHLPCVEAPGQEETKPTSDPMATGMVDFEGYPILVGDSIVVAYQPYRNRFELRRGIVTGTTPTMVKYSSPKRDGAERTDHKATPSKVCVTTRGAP